MSLILIVIHVAVCVALIMIVLFQTGKGADLGAAFGGGASQTLFGSTGASTFLSKATTIAAVVFMITSLSLAYLAGQRRTTSIMDNAKPPIEQPAAPATAPAPATENAPAPATPATESAPAPTEAAAPVAKATPPAAAPEAKAPATAQKQ
jgi:preprotein translocase subunit SecG